MTTLTGSIRLRTASRLIDVVMVVSYVQYLALFPDVLSIGRRLKGLFRLWQPCLMWTMLHLFTGRSSCHVYLLSYVCASAFEHVLRRILGVLEHLIVRF